MRNVRDLIASVSKTQLWIALAVTCVSGPIGFATSYYWLHQPPIVVISARDDGEITARGDDLNYVVRKRDNDVCLTVVSRWLWRPDPQDPTQPQWRPIPDALFGPPALADLIEGKPHIGAVAPYRLTIPLPSTIEPGLWTPLNVALDICQDGIHKPRLNQGKPIQVSAR